MALDITPGESKRPLGVVVLGVVLILVGGYFLYDAERQKSSFVYVPSDYEYSVRQSVNTDVKYLDNSFFPNGPGTNNAAYVKDLTDTVTAEFFYNFEANEDASLTYTYDVKARVLGKHADRGDESKSVNVWSQEYQLVQPVTRTESTRTVTIEPRVEVPFAQYKDTIEQFKTALAVPINSEMVVETTVRMEGTIGDIPFEDKRVMSVTAPLDQQAYTLAVKYDKEDTKPVVAEGEKDNREHWLRYTTIGAVAAMVIGVGLVGFGFRKQIFKTPYQRELERIYRYHDGIIIKARQPADIDGKRIVPVLSFDDMLNLEEELKSPIVASPAGSEATQFIIIHGDIAYLYTLGKLVLDDQTSAAVHDMFVDDIVTAPRKKSKK